MIHCRKETERDQMRGSLQLSVQSRTKLSFLQERMQSSEVPQSEAGLNNLATTNR